MSVTINAASGRSNVAAEQAHRVHIAARRLYAAECASHDAHQTRVDSWILAANEKLHDAIAAHLAAVAATSADSQGASSAGRNV